MNEMIRQNSSVVFSFGSNEISLFLNNLFFRPYLSLFLYTLEFRSHVYCRILIIHSRQTYKPYLFWHPQNVIRNLGYASFAGNQAFCLRVTTISCFIFHFYLGCTSNFPSRFFFWTIYPTYFFFFFFILRRLIIILRRFVYYNYDRSSDNDAFLIKFGPNAKVRKMNHLENSHLKQQRQRYRLE